MGASKIASFTVYFVLLNRPFEAVDKDAPLFLRLLNEHFAWRLACLILEVDYAKTNLPEGIFIGEQIIYHMEHALPDHDQTATWNVTKMNLLERLFHENFKVSDEDGDNANNIAYRD